MPAPSKKRILVVEDDCAIARMLEKILEVDHEVTVAHDGCEGLELARRLRFKVEQVRDKVAEVLR